MNNNEKNLDQIQHILNDIIEGKTVSLKDYPNVLEYKISLSELKKNSEL